MGPFLAYIYPSKCSWGIIQIWLCVQGAPSASLDDSVSGVKCQLFSLVTLMHSMANSSSKLNCLAVDIDMSNMSSTNYIQ